MAGTSWRAKIDNGIPAKIVPGTEKMLAKGYRNMLVSCPADVEALVREIPRGRVVMSAEIRDKLAKDAGADFTCPTSTGIFLWLISNAAEEERPLKGDSVTPYWRVLRAGGELNPKYPGGTENHARLLESEGVKVEGTKVADLDAFRARL